MFSIGSSSKHYDPLTEEDSSETLPMYEMRPKSDFGTPSASRDRVQLHAAPTAMIANMDNFDFEEYVPYQLELGKCGLFPEFYYHFNKNFSAESAENRAYCSRSLQEFTSSYVGHENDILSSVARVEADFDRKFRNCLHPDLLKEYLEWTFTRDCVENQFRESLADRKDLISQSIRLEVLTQKTRLVWEVEPLVDFLLGFGHSESFIWIYLIQVFSWSAIYSPKNQEIMNTAAQKWQSESGSLVRRVQSFADEYKTTAQLTVPLGVKIFLSIFFSVLLGFLVFAIVMAIKESNAK